jgi:hypothetical protein
MLHGRQVAGGMLITGMIGRANPERRLQTRQV